MGRVNDIIVGVRDTLAEKTPKRWENARLLRTLSEGQKKIVQSLLSLRYQCTVELCDGYHTYKLDSSAVEPKGGAPLALFSVKNTLGEFCRFMTTERIAKEFPTWETDTATVPTHIIYDKRKPLHFRVYPKPDATKLSTGETFNTVNEPIADAALICKPLTVESSFDITKEVAPQKLQVGFYLSPPAITTIQDTNLLISEYFDIALKHYVAGMVLRDDKDTQNRNFGIEELKFFEVEYKFAKDIVERNFVDQSAEYYAPVTYNANLT